jgi:hypothetical protein
MAQRAATIGRPRKHASAILSSRERGRGRRQVATRA